MHLSFQRQVKQQLSNIHRRKPATAIGQSIIFIKMLGLLLGNLASVGARQLALPTEAAFAVTVGHHDDVAQGFTLQQMHRGKRPARRRSLLNIMMALFDPFLAQLQG